MRVAWTAVLWQGIVLIGPILMMAGCAKRYPLQGVVLQVDRPAQTVTVSHRSVPGLMSAMVMPFRVRRAEDLRGLHSGVQIQSRLVVNKKHSYLDNIRILGSATDGVVEDQGDKLVLPVPPEKVEIGQIVPDFVLIDQQSRSVRLSDWRGRVVAVNFIYTRCPLPDVCPRLSAHFSVLQRRFAGQMGKDVVLLSVTIDPEYDTPAQLLKYATIWNARPEGWHFLTGSSHDIQSVAGRFGMTYWPEEGLITHTSRTGVISRTGRLSAIVEGSSYRARELGDLIERELKVP